MNRLLFAALLIAAPVASAQPPAAKPTHFPPDAATRQVIAAKTAEFKAAVASLRGDAVPDVAVYLQAVERSVRLDEFLTKDSVKQTLVVLDAGLKRAATLKSGYPSWRNLTDVAVVRGYVSPVDGTVQPYVLTLPRAAHQVGRVDVVLHGRDGTLTEVKLLAQREAAKPAAAAEGVATLEIYGRGNNAYRWAGEADITDVLAACRTGNVFRGGTPMLLRGFSMGGAATWHHGLHHPFAFRVLGPGAGFSTTHGYVGKLPDPLPDYQERCLRIYDAVTAAENVFHVKVVAYSGENDKQKAAADTIVNALKGFKEPYTLTHLVAPGLEHKMPPEWMAKAEAEYVKNFAPPRGRDRWRYVLSTTAYPEYGLGRVTGLERHYEKAVVEVDAKSNPMKYTTINVHSLLPLGSNDPQDLDGQLVTPKANRGGNNVFVKTGGQWAAITAEQHAADLLAKPRKSPGLQGPIDDAFLRPFAVAPAPAGDSPVSASLAASHARFGREWDKYFRGILPTLTDTTTPKTGRVVFGGFDSPLVAAVLPKLPIAWTADTLSVNGVSYDAKTHYPVLIYPDPLKRDRYLVLNSGHTFHAAEFEGSNALLYPRLGDWAVLKLAPTKLDPAHTETVAAGLFDEDWQFAK